MTLDLDELGRIASAATPGPWEISSWHPSDPDGYAEIHADEPEGQVVRLPLAAPNAVRNTTHIAVFNPVTVLALLARARDAERLEKVAIDVMASLAAAISLLERSPKTAAPSNKMFNVMLDDYRASLKSARQALSALNEGDE